MTQPMKRDDEVLSALRESPVGQKAIAQRESARVERRAAIAAEIKQLDDTAARELPPLRAAVDEGLVRLEKAQSRAVAASEVKARAQAFAEIELARAELLVANDASVRASLAYTGRRDSLVHQLRADADPAIKSFRSEMLTEHTKARATPIDARDMSVRSSVTGRWSRAVASNAASVAARMRAIRDAIHAAEQLELEPDQRGVEVKLDALRAGLPAIGGPELPKGDDK